MREPRAHSASRAISSALASCAVGADTVCSETACRRLRCERGGRGKKVCLADCGHGATSQVFFSKLFMPLFLKNLLSSSSPLSSCTEGGVCLLFDCPSQFKRKVRFSAVRRRQGWEGGTSCVVYAHHLPQTGSDANETGKYGRRECDCGGWEGSKVCVGEGTITPVYINYSRATSCPLLFVFVRSCA